MPFESGLSRSWYNKGKAAGRGGRSSDMYAAWHSAKGKPKTPGGRVTAQESFYQGYFDGEEARRKNPAYKRSRTSVRRKVARGMARRSSERRVVAALKKFVRSNPALPAAFRKAKAIGMKRNAGGSVTIRVIPIKKIA